MVMIDIDYQDYQEWKPETYRSVSVLRPGVRIRFDSGDVVKDFDEALGYVQEHYPENMLLYRSSVDQFVADAGGAYYWETVGDYDYLRKGDGVG